MLMLVTVLIAGALLTLAFAPFGVYTFAFISPAILLYSWLRASAKQAFFRGLFFGIGFFTTGTSWIYISIHRFGNASVGFSILITTLFVVVLALYPATQGYLFARLFKNKSNVIRCLCLFPALWVIWEWLRATLFTGFPWLFLGYSQISTLFHGYAPLFGVYGLSLIVAYLCGVLVLLATRESNQTKLIILFSAVVIGFAGYILSKESWTKPTGKPITVSLVQGNIPQTVKWQKQQLQKTLQIYKNLTNQHWQSHIIIWPEAAVPAFIQQVPDFIDNMDQMAKHHHTNLIFGAPIYNPSTRKAYNGMLMIGENKGIYLKRHLVPFGEYLPLKSIFGFFSKYVDIPMTGFSSGPKQQPPMQAGTLSIAPYICYEIAYPEEVLDTVKGKQLMVTISDDSWFGKSIALAQHMQIAQLRALEMGRYLLLSSNTGITAFINPEGQVIKIAPLDKRVVITAKVTGMQGNTPLMEWDYWPVLGMILMLLAIGYLSKKKNKDS